MMSTDRRRYFHELLKKHGLQEEYVYDWGDGTVTLDGCFTPAFLHELANLLEQPK
jgi:hypothetical protein